MRRFVIELGCGCRYIISEAPRLGKPLICSSKNNGRDEHGMSLIVMAETYDHYVARVEADLRSRLPSPAV